MSGESYADMNARVLAIANRKGGTGKSTIAVNLAAEFGALGYRTLVIDLDPQGHAGFGFGANAADERRSVHTVFVEAQVDLSGSIQHTNEPDVDLIPADRNFGQTRIDDPQCLARALDPIRSRYDVILLDCPPAAADIIVSALLAADGVLVPVTLDHLALDGAQQFARSYHRVMLSLHATLLGLAITPMRVDLRSSLQKFILSKALRGFGRAQVTSGIRADVAVGEAFGHRRPLRRYRQYARAADDFRVLAGDVAQRFAIPLAGW